MHARKKLASLIILSLVAACPDHIADTDATGENPSSSTGAHGTDGASVTSAATTAEESATLIMGSTSMPDTGDTTATEGDDQTTGDGIHHSPIVCETLDPTSCMPGDSGWCADVVVLCDLLNPQNTNPGFCEDMGEICEAMQVSDCTVCAILKRQCEIEADTAILCDDYAATCGCLLDAHTWS